MSLSLFASSFPAIETINEIKLILGPGHYEVVRKFMLCNYLLVGSREEVNTVPTE